MGGRTGGLGGRRRRRSSRDSVECFKKRFQKRLSRGEMSDVEFVKKQREKGGRSLLLYSPITPFEPLS